MQMLMGRAIFDPSRLLPGETKQYPDRSNVKNALVCIDKLNGTRHGDIGTTHAEGAR